MGRFEGKVAVVTGGASGIGRACCVRFGSEGAAVVVADRDVRRGADTVAAVEAKGARAVFAQLDATSRLDNDSMAAAAVERFGRLDFLVTAAGISHASYTGETETEVKRFAERARYVDEPYREVVEYDVGEFRTVLDVNLIGTFLAIQACVSRMVECDEVDRGGSVVTIASIAAKNPNAGPIAYTASKAGVWMLTKKLAIMLAKAQVRVNAIGPGFIETPMTQVVDLMSAEQRDMFMAAIPMGRRGQPEDIAAAAAFLCSDDASYFTGEILHPDGGFYTE